MLFTRSVSLPESRIKGIVNNDGNEVSNCMSNSEAWGKIVDNCPRIGDTASPGRALSADMDQMPTSVISGIVPRPVSIFIGYAFYFITGGKQPTLPNV